LSHFVVQVGLRCSTNPPLLRTNCSFDKSLCCVTKHFFLIPNKQISAGTSCQVLPLTLPDLKGFARTNLLLPVRPRGRLRKYLTLIPQLIRLGQLQQILRRLQRFHKVLLQRVAWLIHNRLYPLIQATKE